MTKREHIEHKYTLPVWRFYLILGICLVSFAGLGVRAAWIQVFESEFYKSEGESRVVRYQGINGQRGVIRDRNGEELATSIPVYSAVADPVRLLEEKQKYPDLFETSAWIQLASLFDLSGDDLTQRIEKNSKKRFIWLKRHIDPTHANIILRLKIPGINLEEESKRYYPATEVAAHVVGFTDTDERGLEGIEKAFDSRLKGEDGRRRIIKDRHGNPIDAADILDDAMIGEDLDLSIDIRIQTHAYKTLKAAVKKYRAIAGTAVVMDIDTGEVLAMVNQPSYNPNNLSTRVPNATRNRAITDVFEPGSTVKPLTALSGLASGLYAADTLINTSPGYMRVGGRWVRDASDYGKLSVSQVIEKSSNIGVAHMALSMDDDTFLDSFYKVDFGSHNATGFPGETAGHLNIRRNWSDIEKATLSFGYGLDVSALQLAKAYSIIGGLGKSRPVSLLKVTGPVPYKQVFDPIVTSKVIEMMAHVISEEGTGKKAKVDGYRVSGKTGTALKAIPGGYGDAYFAIFAGVAPVRNPRLSVVVMIDEPAGEIIHGGDVSAPVFASIMKQSLRTLNIAPDLVNTNEIQLSSRGAEE